MAYNPPPDLKSNNGGTPGSSNIGTLPSVCAAAAPTYVDGNQAALRVTTTGDLAITLDGESVTAQGGKTNNGGVPGATNLGTLPAVCATSAPTHTNGNQTALRVTASGDVAVTLDSEAVVLGAGAAVIGALTANQSVNNAQVNGVALSTGNGVSGTGVQRVAIASDNTPFSVSIGNSTGKTVRMIAGQLTTTATTADQVVGTHTVTGGTTFYLTHVSMNVTSTTPANNNSDNVIYGTMSFQIGGTNAIIRRFACAPGVGGSVWTFSEPLPIAAGTVLRIVCTPAAATSFIWDGNFGGYEK